MWILAFLSIQKRNWVILCIVVIALLIIIPFILWIHLPCGQTDMSAYAQSHGKVASPLALVVYAQPNFKASRIRATDQISLKNPGTIVADTHGGFYVADYDNNRVLHFPATTGTGAGLAADQVYGQPDYTSNAPGLGATGLNRPHGVALDPQGGLYIADMLNCRVLHYPANSTIADRVYGQIDFNSNLINSGGLSTSGLFHPQGLAVDQSGLYVADSSNNRVLHFPTGSTIADRVYGQGGPGNSQANFMSNVAGSGLTGLNTPRDVAVNNTGLYIADSGNHRVVHYVIDSASADRVYGQPDFGTTSIQSNQGSTNPTAFTLNNPTGLTLDNHGGLYVADRSNNRVLYYPLYTENKVNDPPATRLYGQSSYQQKTSSTSASTFNGPGAVSVDTFGDVFVLDIFNQRVLKFMTSLSITQFSPTHINVGTLFSVRVELRDAASGIVFTDYHDSPSIAIKPGTGPMGATLDGTTTVHALNGIATFRDLAFRQAGDGYILVVSSYGYASAATAPFLVGPSSAKHKFGWAIFYGNSYYHAAKLLLMKQEGNSNLYSHFQLVK